MRTFEQDLAHFREVRASVMAGRARTGWTPRRDMITRRNWTVDRVIQALQAWAATHGGLAPRQSDWKRATAETPSVETVERLGAAHRQPPRRFINVPESDGICHGGGYWEGPSDWAYVLGLAGLEVRRSSDQLAKRGRTLGRNRQMVTGGAPASPDVIYVPEATGRGHVR